MKYFFLSFFILYLFSSFRAGVRIAKLSCKSASGRTVFNAELENMESLQNASLSIDKETVNFTYADKCYVTFYPEDKVLTMHLESEANSNFDTLRYVQFWATPASFKDISEQPGPDTYTFNAKLKAMYPRGEKSHESPVIGLACTLVYEYP